MKDFRNYQDITIDLSPGVSVFLADNGSGKTNILEAVHYLSHLAGHRIGGNEVLVRRGAPTAHLATRLHEGDSQKVLEIQLPVAGRRILTIDKSAVSQARRFRNQLRTIMFAPEDLDLVRGEAAFRRDELDQLAEALFPSEANVRSDFDQALKQRNSLLKTLQRAEPRQLSTLKENLEVWTEKFVEASTALWTLRLRAIEAIASQLHGLYAKLTNEQDKLTIQYVPKSLETDAFTQDMNLAEELRVALSRFSEVEIARGVTMVGPHRDEIILEINGLPARTHASQGEAWSVALVWRIASFDLLTEKFQTAPILLLDDVFTQIDGKRRELVVDRFKLAEQVLITTAVATDVPDRMWNHKFEIKGGEVIAVT